MNDSTISKRNTAKALAQFRDDTNEGLINYKSAVKAKKLAVKRYDEAVIELSNVDEAKQIAEQIALEVQNQSQKRISAIVTRCLQAVFDEPYEFLIKFERKRGKTEARLVFKRGGLEVDPLTAAGGGVVDVAGFALRLSNVMLHQPRLAKLLIMDEPFKFVSADKRPAIRQLIEDLATELEVQIVMVTHVEELVTGKVVEIV